MSSKSKNHEKGGEPKDTRVKVTAMGATVKVDPDMFNDVEVLDYLGDLQAGNPFKIPKLLRHVFGEQYDGVMDKLRGADGRVRADKAAKFMEKVMEKAVPNS